MAATSWRVIGIECAEDLVLSKLELADASGRVDSGATLTSSVAPTSGALSALSDGDPGSACSFALADIRGAGFWIRWDLSASADVIDLPLHGNLLAATVQYLSGNRWATAFRLVPGRSTDYMFPRASALWLLNGTLADSVENRVLAEETGRAISWGVGRLPGALAAAFNGSSGGASASRVLRYPNVGVTAFGASDFEIAAWVWIRPQSGSSYARIMESKAIGALGGWNLVQVLQTNPLTIRFHLSDGATVMEAVTTSEAWHYVEVRRKNGTAALLIDGDVKATAASIHNFSAPDLSIGGNLNYSELLYGRVSDVMIVNGFSRSLESYTLQTDPSPRWVLTDRVATRGESLCTVASAPLATAVVSQASALQMARDAEFGGTGRVWGTTKIKGVSANVPTKARVVLLHQRSKLLVRETWSDPVTGYFVFDGVDTSQQFITYAEDIAGNFLPVAANRLAPKVP